MTIGGVMSLAVGDQEVPERVAESLMMFQFRWSTTSNEITSGGFK